MVDIRFNAYHSFNDKDHWELALKDENNTIRLDAYRFL